jgi:hypothetical protein
MKAEMMNASLLPVPPYLMINLNLSFTSFSKSIPFIIHMPLGDAVSVCSELDAKLVEIVIEFEKYQDIMNEMGECLRQVLIMGDIITYL